MSLSAILPFVFIAVIAFIALRVVSSVIRSSMKLAMWAMIAVVVLGAGFLWYQNQGGDTGLPLPALNIPTQPR